MFTKTYWGVEVVRSQWYIVYSSFLCMKWCTMKLCAHNFTSKIVLAHSIRRKRFRRCPWQCMQYLLVLRSYLLLPCLCVCEIPWYSHVSGRIASILSILQNDFIAMELCACRIIISDHARLLVWGSCEDVYFLQDGFVKESSSFLLVRYSYCKNLARLTVLQEFYT